MRHRPLCAFSLWFVSAELLFFSSAHTERLLASLHRRMKVATTLLGLEGYTFVGYSAAVRQSPEDVIDAPYLVRRHTVVCVPHPAFTCWEEGGRNS